MQPLAYGHVLKARGTIGLNCPGIMTLSKKPGASLYMQNVLVELNREKWKTVTQSDDHRDAKGEMTLGRLVL